MHRETSNEIPWPKEERLKRIVSCFRQVAPNRDEQGDHLRSSDDSPPIDLASMLRLTEERKLVEETRRSEVNGQRGVP